MGKLDIAKRDGMVELPIGDVIRADLTHDEFRTSALYLNARTTRTGDGTADYQFGIGEFEGYRWRATISFFNQLLLHMDMCANLYPKGQWKKVENSIDVETETKRFHEQLLLQQLGAPDSHDDLESIRTYDLSGAHVILAKRSTWRFPWGKVISFHDFSEHRTEVRVVYATRHQQKMKRFVRRRKQ